MRVTKRTIALLLAVIMAFSVFAMISTASAVDIESGKILSADFSDFTGALYLFMTAMEILPLQLLTASLPPPPAEREEALLLWPEETLIQQTFRDGTQAILIHTPITIYRTVLLFQ